jgi:hypothetical protein
VTSVGVFAIHQLAPKLFGGFEGNERSVFLATPEKALFDLVYVRAAAGSRAHVPELQLPKGFDRGELDRWSQAIQHPRLRTIVRAHLDDQMEPAAVSGF